MLSRMRGGLRDFEFDEIPWDAIKKWAPVVIIVLVVIFAALGSFVQVAPHEEAVILRFGRHLKTVGPGLHLKLPVVDAALKVSTEVRTLEFGRQTLKAGKDTLYGRRTDLHKGVSLMLTGDLNCADVQWTINYNVRDPYDYLFQVEEVDETIRDVSETIMRTLVGDRSLHEVITTGGTELRQEAQKLTQTALDELKCGVAILQLDIINAAAPEEVREAFQDVNVARQEYGRSKQEAKRERRTIEAQAAGQKAKLEQEALGYSEQVTKKAEGERDALLARFAAYQKAPEATRKRLYLEAMQEVLTNVKRKIIIDDQIKGMLPLLPLRGGEGGGS